MDYSDYSGYVGELGVALFRRNDPQRLFVLLTCYIDESGTHGSGTTVLGAYVGTAQQWDIFENKSRALFAEKGVKKYHAIDLRRNDGDFKGWTVTEKGEFRDHLSMFANDLAFSFVCVLIDKEYDEHYAKGLNTRLARKDTKYGICFRAILSQILARLLKDRPQEWATGNLKIHFVAESGHKNQGSTLALYTTIKKYVDADVKNVLGGLTFECKDKCVPLCVSDTLAYWVWREETNQKNKIVFLKEIKSASNFKRNQYRIGFTKRSFDTLKSELISLDAHMTSEAKQRKQPA